MRVGAAALAGGLFGVAGTLCFLLAFGTDYWLVASDDCGPYSWPREETEANGTEVRRSLTCLLPVTDTTWIATCWEVFSTTQTHNYLHFDVELTSAVA